jgi:hypothetical protein
MTYDLNDVDDINNINISGLFHNINSDESKTNLNNLKIDSKEWVINNKKYQILKYDKDFLNYDMIEKTGLIRSIILNEKGDIISFSPPKSISYDNFINKYKVENCWGEEFIEGTMINMFFDSITDEWEIATKGTIGGRVSYFRNGEQEKKTFRTMFLEATNKAKMEFDLLNKDYCYSFVLQHPENRIVCPIREIKIYLTAVYKINNDTLIINEVNKAEYKQKFEETDVKFPEIYEMNDFTTLGEKFASMNTSYDIMGVVYKTNGARCSLLNPNYIQVKSLRGNQPKLQYTYLSLRKEAKVKDYLKFYPEHKIEFSLFRQQLHLFTHSLHSNYMKCYVFKEKPLSEFPKQFRHHMFTIHQDCYLAELREKQEKVTLWVVINYLNDLHPAKLMYVLNYNIRKNVLDSEVNSAT